METVPKAQIAVRAAVAANLDAHARILTEAFLTPCPFLAVLQRQLGAHSPGLANRPK